MTTPPLATAQSFDEVEAWVLDHLVRTGEPGSSGIVDITQAAVRPSSGLIACTVHLRASFVDPVRRRVALVDAASGDLRLVEVPAPQSCCPAWSPDGRLALVAVADDGTTAVVVLEVGPSGAPEVVASGPPDVPGLVETVEWSPDGSRLALQVAEPGAEISDAFGSGVVGGAAEPSWRPRVSPGRAGRRLAVVWDPVSGRTRTLGAPNVWELAWAGDGALLALTSERADEGGWYDAVLARLDLADGAEPAGRTVHVPDHQLAQPRSGPSGGGWSVIAGVLSDRGMPAGTLLVAPAGDAPAPVDTGGVDVSDHRWLDDETLLVAGLRGLETVVARVGVVTGEVVELWSGLGTSGVLVPEVTGVAGQPPAIVLEDHATSPTLGVLEAGGFRALLGTDGPGARLQAARAGRVEPVEWTSTDGLLVQGLLSLPDGDAPHALVVDVHGGPTHAWRDVWTAREPHPAALVARGYAVLRPNPRGSTGRGPEFAAAVYGDMGRLDVDDVLTGVQHLVAAGVADPARVGVTGISYGGYMAAWMPCLSEAFAASVSRSPATDMLTQHLTSNIADFDRLFVQGDPFDPASDYATRSPLRVHERIRTPMLLTAGDHDLATPASQAQMLYAALARRGVPAELAIYPEEGHGVQQPLAVADQVARTVLWFERFMAAGPVRNT